MNNYPKMRSMIVVPSLLFLLSLVNSQPDGDCDPTPQNFPTLFRDGCVALPQSDAAECNSYWSAFSSVFANMDPSGITTTHYEDYFDMFPITAEMDTFLFWSQTIELTVMLSCMCDAADVFAGPNYLPIAIMDKIADQLDMPMTQLRWCGTTSSGTDGIQYTGMCPCSTSYAFFQEFSVRFAKAAKGTIFYLGFGESERGAFPLDSFFAEHEISALNPDVVDRAVIMVMHVSSTDGSTSETCGQGSLLTLQRKLVAQIPSIEYSCYDVYGYPVNTDSSLVQLTDCAANIITSIQEDREPADDPCFKKEVSCPLNSGRQRRQDNGTDPCNGSVSVGQGVSSLFILLAALLVLVIVAS